VGEKALTELKTQTSIKPPHPPAGKGIAAMINPTIYTSAGFLLSAVLLSVIYEPFGLWPLAWIAWVPFMLVCGDRVSTKRLLLSAYIVGLAYWIYNLHWLYLVTFAGYIAFAFFQALYWPAMAYCVRTVRRKRWPLFVFAPLLFVGAEAIQGYLFTGFGWYYLAHSQYKLLGLIQICDIFGVLGVSVLVAMVNGLVGDWILLIGRKQRRIGRLAPPRFCFIATIVIAVLLTGAWWYGHYRLSQTPAYLTEGPLVGSVQPNVPSNEKEQIENGPKILSDLIADSNSCVEAGAKLVVWPETMVLAAMNPEYLSYCDPLSDPVQFQKKILAFCKGRCYVLFGATSVGFGYVDGTYDITDQYNSAFLYRPDGEPDPKRYDKMHLVPFGEYIPFKKSAPWIYKTILFLSPYDYDYNLTAGRSHTVFEINVNDQTYRFCVLICYEDTDPTLTRRHVLDKNGNKRCDWLVNISNDGWYVRFKNEKVLPMAELGQRTAISVFRCVENRVSIVRSVNTGISCLIEPTGAIRNDYTAGNLPKEAMARQGVAGWFVDTVPIDSRITVFSRYGRWLDIMLGTFFVLNLGFSVYSSRNYRPKTEE
jgi:apolipoprotein N-acyltransferase